MHRDIIGYVKKALEDSGYMSMLQNGAGLVLTGGGSNLRHIIELCQYELGLNTRIGYPVVGFADTISNELKQPLFSTSLGLLKYGLLEQKIEEDSFVRNQRVEKGRFEGNNQDKDFGDEKETLWSRLRKTFENVFEQIS